MLIRGAIQDRLWGKTLGALARRAVSGQLTIRSDKDTFAIVFADGHVVAAVAPGSAETVIGLALQQDLITPGQVAALTFDPDRDEAQLVEDAGLLSPDQILRLRRQAITAAATRTFALEHGDFEFGSEITLPVVPNTAIHVGGLIHHGVLANLSDARLAAAVRELGAVFRVRSHELDDLRYFGFGEPERAVVRVLDDGLSISQIDALRDSDRRIARTTIYTLASLGSLDCEAAPTAPAPRLARGTRDPISNQAQETPAATAYRQGQAALRDDRLDDAIAALERANELAPDNIDYRCTLTWARFCREQDKHAVADSTRAALKQAALRTQHPVAPHYYLGLVERMLGRAPQALAHFQHVLELEPTHREAGTELRFLSRLSRP